MKKLIFISYSLLAAIVINAQEVQNNKPDRMKPALVIVDIQNEFIPKMSEQEKKYVFEVINGSIWCFRQKNLPIIRVYHSDVNWGPFDGSEEFSYPKSIIIKDSDLKITKN
jgi:isochorismate hydrolase